MNSLEARVQDVLEGTLTHSSYYVRAQRVSPLFMMRDCWGFLDISIANVNGRMINSEYEFVALHRDIGETELKQGREIRAGGNLVYVDSAAVRAVKHGRVLILEGIEKAERGIMPVNSPPNILE